MGPAWLRDRYSDPALRLLDASALPDYRDSHIPGAQHFWWQDLIELHNPVYGMLIGPEQRQEVVRAAGIAPDSVVVCYDQSGGIYASRLIWVLRYMGFENCHLLSGGLTGWQKTGGELTNAEVDVSLSGGISDIRDETININANDVLSRIGVPNIAVLDTRTSDEINEQWRGQLRVGRIPQSRWMPRSQFLADSPASPVVTPQDLADRLMRAGLDLDETAEIIVYGLHATLASLPWLALTTLGGPSVRLYDGSWAEWGSRDDLPLEALPVPG